MDKDKVAEIAKALWNASADRFNQWDVLSDEEREEEIARVRAEIERSKERMNANLQNDIKMRKDLEE